VLWIVTEIDQSSFVYGSEVVVKGLY